MQTTAFSDYKVPRFADVPAIDVHVLDRPDLPSIGAGETPIVAVAPAIANAVFDAVGKRIREMPIQLSKAEAPKGGKKGENAGRRHDLRDRPRSRPLTPHGQRRAEAAAAGRGQADDRLMSSVGCCAAHGEVERDSARHFSETTPVSERTREDPDLFAVTPKESGSSGVPSSPACTSPSDRVADSESSSSRTGSTTIAESTRNAPRADRHQLESSTATCSARSAGASAIPPDCRGVLVAPADDPHVPAEIVQQMIATFAAST